MQNQARERPAYRCRGRGRGRESYGFGGHARRQWLRGRRPGRQWRGSRRTDRKFRPDVVCMDVKMPRMDGIAAAGIICDENIAPVVMLTAFSQTDLVKKPPVPVPWHMSPSRTRNPSSCRPSKSPWVVSLKSTIFWTTSSAANASSGNHRSAQGDRGKAQEG